MNFGHTPHSFRKQFFFCASVVIDIGKTTQAKKVTSTLCLKMMKMIKPMIPFLLIYDVWFVHVIKNKESEYDLNLTNAKN